MILLICALFLILSLTTLFITDNSIKPYEKNTDLFLKILFIFIGILLFFISGFRAVGIDRDYYNYINLYEENKDSWSFLIEPSFILISKFVKTCFNSNVTFLFVLFALIGVSTKMYAIKQLSEFWSLSLLLYISYSFILQDMTQIRVGVAAGFILLSIEPLYERKFWKFLIFSICAILFHYTALIIILLWFLNPTKINVKLYGLIIILVYLINLTSSFYISELLQYIPILPLQNKILA